MEVGCSKGEREILLREMPLCFVLVAAEVDFSGLGSVPLGPRFTSVGSGAANSRTVVVDRTTTPPSRQLFNDHITRVHLGRFKAT